MKKINNILISNNNKQEILSNMNPDFPYISSYSELDKYPEKTAPWHWHEPIELFYVKSGSLEYNTPQGKKIFTKGQAGILNSNVLHKTRSLDENGNTVLLIHMFRPVFLSGKKDSLIDKSLIAPFTSSHEIELMQFTNKKHKELIRLIKESFTLNENDLAFPIMIRSTLCDLWIRILELNETKVLLSNKNSRHVAEDKLKSMMVYIHEHYCEKIAIIDIANSAFISERECYRTFKNSLQLTPLEYLYNYRIQKASYRLRYTIDPITTIALSCGFSSSSYFGKVFKEYTNHNPNEYRALWQDIDSE